MSLIKLQYLNEACAGDDELRSDLLAIFVEQAQSIGDTLANCLADNNFDLLARNAHKFKSTALSLGMTQTADCLKKIEVIAKKLYVNSDAAGKDDNAKRLYLSQINGLTPEIDDWTNQNLNTTTLSNLINFCKLHSQQAAQEAINLINNLAS
ncbi:MAG: Hpt domain-containing protein [Bacteroidales bacterium]|nr:Hpt domain-containing protein [Bacteroidales bacterium]MDD7724613.1 Hpt domain-containing protein [Bacteroidales bacterium]MDY4174165.1 Hpt domain-containing protein [Bacteroidales bacterium]